MYDIRQFKPVLYVVLILGLTAFSMAAESMVLLVLSVLGVGLNAVLVFTGRFAPLPRWLANIATLSALLYVGLRINAAADEGSPPLMFVGQFLVLLHLIKLYEQRANRDYAQLLVLSLLLMVAASINTASLLFGLLMIVYLVLALYCCLLFHLKAQADRARTAFAIPEDKISPATLRLDQRYFGLSMRRLTVLVTVFAMGGAVLVFLFAPRGPGQGILGQLQFRRPTALVGISDSISLESINNILQNEEVVAHVFLWKNERPILGTEILYLRGGVFDAYASPLARGGARPQWSRTQGGVRLREFPAYSSPTGDPLLLPEGDVWRQRINLRPTGTQFLFALPGIKYYATGREHRPAFTPARSVRVYFSETDLTLHSEPINLPLDYTVLCSNARARPDLGRALETQVLLFQSESDPGVLAEARKYAQSFLGERIAARGVMPVQPDNYEIAQLIERHLRTEFEYTLDLTGSRAEFRGIDPVIAFLTRVKKGHCEYFASAMALMCQSLGIPARVVVGFKCDDPASFNAIGGYYIVRQSDAHAWVEVLTSDGWVTFDPTSGRMANDSARAGWWQAIRHFVDYLDYKWGELVIAYDNTARDNLVRDLDATLTNTAIRGVASLARLGGLDQSVGFWRASLGALNVLLGSMVAAMLLASAWFLINKLRLRRRAARIGLDGLPVDQQLRLARQLAFYDRLIRVLGRHHIVRPRHQTHREFADSLVFLPAEPYDLIQRLTRVFYRVRFGQAQLHGGLERHLFTAVSRVARSLAGRDDGSADDATGEPA